MSELSSLIRYDTVDEITLLNKVHGDDGLTNYVIQAIGADRCLGRIQHLLKRGDLTHECRTELLSWQRESENVLRGACNQLNIGEYQP